MDFTQTKMRSIINDFQIDYMMRYNVFVPRLYNLCRELGFDMANIMPSRAFCSDENQGFPIILITKHFGAFPFDHGRAGGIVAINRHGPHAQHGNDLLIIQASHVGYDPDTQTFGTYCRLQTPDNKETTTCGKIGGVLSWYLDEYQFAQNNIYIGNENGLHTITIDNQLLDENREEGLFLNLSELIAVEKGRRKLIQTLSTSRVYVASDQICDTLAKEWPDATRRPIGNLLGPELFVFQRKGRNGVEGEEQLEKNLHEAMPWIVTAPSPMLAAAQVNTQVEFDQTFRSIVKSPVYKDKKLLFISALHIDISPKETQMFPLTKCIPWAAYFQNGDGISRPLEQKEIFDLLSQQSAENPNQIDMETAIQKMVDTPEVKVLL